MATTPPKPPTLTPQQQRTIAANPAATTSTSGYITSAAAQKQAAAEQAKSVALQNQARKIANANKLYTYEQPTKEDLMRAESLRQAYTMDWSRGTPFGYGMSGAVFGSGKMPADVAKEIQRLKSPKLVGRASPEQGYVRDDINNPFIHSMQQQDLIRAEQAGRNYQTAADGTVYDVATSAGKKEFDENNAYWKSVGGYQLGGMKKGGTVKKKPARSKPTKRYAAGGSVGGTSRRGDGCASKGKTRCKIR